MDINSIGNIPASISQASTGDAVAILVLKKTLDIQEQNALQLIQSLQPATNNPPNLGGGVDTFA